MTARALVLPAIMRTNFVFGALQVASTVTPCNAPQNASYANRKIGEDRMTVLSCIAGYVALALPLALFVGRVLRLNDTQAVGETE